MASVSFLTNANFVVLGTQHKTLGINIPGPVLVFFKIRNDPNCSKFDPVFASLSKMDPRISYAVLDVDQFKDVVAWSRTTTTPITAVPMVILYVNGRPHAKYNGTKDIPSLRSFISSALQQTPPPQPVAPPGGGNNLYGGGANAGTAKKFVPEMGSAPSLKGVIKGGPSPTGYSAGGSFVHDEEEGKLMVPDTVIPHNTPWETQHQQEY